MQVPMFSLSITKEEKEIFEKLDLLIMYGKHSEKPEVHYRDIGICLICHRPVYLTGEGFMRKDFGERWGGEKEKVRVFAMTCVAMMMAQVSDAMMHPEELQKVETFKMGGGDK